MIIPTLFLLGTDPWLNLAVCVVFCALTLSRVQFAHPVAVREHRPISIGFMIAWLGSMTWLAIAQRDVRPVRIVLIVAPLWTVVQVLLRLRANAATRNQPPTPTP